MIGNGQKSVWEHHVGIETIIFCDFWCLVRYSGVLEMDVYVNSQDPKVGYT